MALTIEKKQCRNALLKVFKECGLEPGDRIPGERRLSRNLPFTRHVIRESLAGLKRDGILESRAQSGSYLLVHPQPEAMPTEGPDLRPIISVMLMGSSDIPMIRGLQEWMMEKGCILHSYFASEHGNSAAEERTYLEWAAAQGFTGVIIHPTPFDPQSEELYQRMTDYMTLVHIGYHSVELPQQSFFLPDYTLAGTQAFTWLLSRGFRKIHLLSSMPEGHHMNELLMRGIRTASATANAEVSLHCYAARDADEIAAAAESEDQGWILFGDSPRRVIGKVPGIASRAIQITDRAPMADDYESRAGGELPELAFSLEQRLHDSISFILDGAARQRHRLYAPVPCRLDIPLK